LPTEESGALTLHVPPKFNLNGNRQIWFFETGNHTIDNFGNGLVAGVPFVVLFMILAEVGGLI
jgi:hypothetical protein